MPKRRPKPRSFRSEARSAPGVATALWRLGRAIRELRLKRELSQEALAARAGLDAKHVQALEAGNTNATVASLVGLARALGVSVADLLGGT